MDRRKRIIDASEKALVELEKVIKQNIDLSELDPEKAKIAAQAKWVAIDDSLKIVVTKPLGPEKIPELGLGSTIRFWPFT